MKQLIPALFAVGAVMLLIGAAVYVTGWPLSPYIYTIGATFVALAQINSPSSIRLPLSSVCVASRYSEHCYWCLPELSCFSRMVTSGLFH